jgi:hypothetical protein
MLGLAQLDLWELIQSLPAARKLLSILTSRDFGYLNYKPLETQQLSGDAAKEEAATSVGGIEPRSGQGEGSQC